MKKIFLVAFLLIPFSAQAKVNITRNIHYGKNPSQIVDVYQTEQCIKRSCPVVMWVHGGGWRHGDTGGSRSTDMQTKWAEQGIVMVGVNYRLSPKYVHPAHIQDVAAAINWVNKNIANYGGDPKKISLLGHSAGAHLVALVATNSQYLNAYGLTPKNIANVFPIDTASFDLTNPSRIVGRMVKEAFGTNIDVLKEASPIWNVVPQGSYPPFIIAVSQNRDDAVATSEALRDKLLEAQTPVQLMIRNYPKVGQLKAHGMIANELADMDSDMTKTLIKRVISQ